MVALQEACLRGLDVGFPECPILTPGANESFLLLDVLVSLDDQCRQQMPNENLRAPSRQASHVIGSENIGGTDGEEERLGKGRGRDRGGVVKESDQYNERG